MWVQLSINCPNRVLDQTLNFREHNLLKVHFYVDALEVLLKVPVGNLKLLKEP
jgi:hypothetical protein